ncbi:MAG: endonuclease [Acholeplasmataceae bacterium]|nr:endonuclease [Acholeplasmataceae bacterium]
MKHFRFLVLLLVLLLVGCTKLNIDDIKDEIVIGYVSDDNQNSVQNDLTLPTVVEGIEITWTSDSEFVVIKDNKAVVERQDVDVTVTLTATFEFRGKTESVDFEVILKKLETAQFDIEAFRSFLDIPNSTFVNLTLATSYENNLITWSSSNEDVLSNEGVVSRKDNDETVVLTATVTVDGEIQTVDFEVIVLKVDVENPDYYTSLNKITLPATTIVHLELPSTIDGYDLSWISDNDAISSTGLVTRQTEDVIVTLTATIVEKPSFTKSFTVTVLKEEDTIIDYDIILNKITIPTHASTNLVLPTLIDDVELTWFSNHSSITDSGIVIRQAEDVTVTLTVKVIEDMTFFKTFDVVVNKRADYPISNHMPIADVREKTQGAAVKIQGVVTSLMSNGNYSIQDSSGAIPVYFGKDKNNALVTGTEYVIEGELGSFQGLIQIINPKIIETLGNKTLPEGIDITGYSLEFEDITLFEANIVTYFGLEVTAKDSDSNALELVLKNDANETTMVRLDQRVNDSPYPFTDIKVGEIVDLFNVTLGQYTGEAQLLFTRRSSIEARPKNPEIISIYGTNSKNFIVGEAEPNLLEGITAKNGFNTDFTHLLDVDDSLVNLNVTGNYKVTVYLTTDSSVFATYTLYVRKPAEPGVYEGYYERLDGLTGVELNNELRDLIRNTGISTGSTSQVKSVDKVGTSYYLIYEDMGSYGNREHVWPNSKLGSVKYDLHNLRAAKVSTNSDRGNVPFVDNNKPFTGSSPYEEKASGWYPGDKHIGDVARIVFYISIREKLSLNLVGNVNLFLEWHELDPVDDFEINRNDKIFEIQNNRNPFIDHPELAQIYFGNGTMSTTLALLDLTFDMFSYNRNYAI